MPFEKGHPYHAPAHDERGLNAPVRKAQRDLAVLIEDIVDFRDIVGRVLSYAQGVDPVTKTLVEPALAFAAQKYLIERRFGSTPQVVDITARVGVVGVQLGPPAGMAQMSDAELAQLEDALARIGVTAALPAGSEDE